VLLVIKKYSQIQVERIQIISSNVLQSLNFSPYLICHCNHDGKIIDIRPCLFCVNGWQCYCQGQKKRENKGVGLIHQSMDSNVGRKRKKKIGYLFPRHAPLSN